LKLEPSLIHESGKKFKLENVLVMQGGGSLGAYECGVYKTLAEKNIKFDIIAGTSIGAINASIIVGSKSNHPEKTLEDFWLDIADKTIPDFFPKEIQTFYSTVNAFFWGNPKAFEPVIPFSAYFSYLLPFLYHTKPFRVTLERYIDFEKLNSSETPRLIVTSVDIQKGKAITFDSKHTKIGMDHILASAGFPFYGISWTKINDRFLWDGSLMSNTPLREVIHASPKSDKNVFIVSLFPRNHDELPRDMAESWHRARDIMHTDKTEHSLQMSKIISRYLKNMKEMHEIILNSILNEKQKQQFEKMESEYHKLACDRGAIIQKITKIERQEKSHYLFEDADFSISSIKRLISQGIYDTKKDCNYSNI
jgi:NTE family protein